MHLAVKNCHEELTRCWFGVEKNAILIGNNDGMRPQDIAKTNGFVTLHDGATYMRFHICLDIEMATRRSVLSNGDEKNNVCDPRVIRPLKAAFEGEEDSICRILEEDASLILHKDPR